MHVRIQLALVLAITGCRGDPRTTPVTPPPTGAGTGSATSTALASGTSVDAAPPAPDGAPPAPDAAPPAPDDWVDVAAAIPDAVLDMRYARAENFTGQVLYPVARCLLRRAVAERLARAADSLRAQHRRLLLWDCYRPASLQRVLWERVKDPRYVAEPVFDKAGAPVSGSRHSRGAAIDVGLVDADGGPVTLPTAHDDFTRAAHRGPAKRSKGKAELAILDAALAGAGFVGLPTEWWHYDAPDAATFPLADVPLDLTTP